MMSLILAGPGIAAILVVGVLVSAFQALTRINDATLSFIPKLVALAAVIVILSPGYSRRW
jgi:flagellar biosynthetic protein FliQ